MLTPGKLIWRVAIALVILAAVMMLSLLVGSQDISLRCAFQGPQIDQQVNIDYVILVQQRLPRIFMAAIVGAALACAGVVFQAILRNPLADPYILGISSGAGLGAIVAVMLGWTWTLAGLSAMTAAAFIGAMATVWLVWIVGQVAGRANMTGLLLAGVVINAFFSAMIMFLSSIAKANELQTTIVWLMGNMLLPESTIVLWACGAVVLCGVLGLLALGNRLNILSFGSVDAHHLGMPVGQTCFWAFGAAALITSIAVSLSGLVGFVGLIVPHAVRLVAGPDHRQLIPLSAIVGAAFLVAADAVARVVVAPAILPVGVVTALVGGPFFLILLIRYIKNIQWGRP